MKYCVDCHTPSRDYMEFCPKCGNNLNAKKNRDKGFFERIFQLDWKAKK
jgi:hypothetical protein